jgi:hypothetical protein
VAIDGFTKAVNFALPNIVIKCSAQRFITITLPFAFVYVRVEVANNIVVVNSSAIKVDGGCALDL